MNIYLVFICFFLNFTNLALANVNQKELLFCYEDKALPPYFLGEGLTVPNEHPGATIELMQQVDQNFPQLKVKYTRKPWKRCLDDLSKSTVDAVVGSYHIEREKIGVFPKLNGEVDTQRAISNHAMCFLKYKNSTFSWDGENIKGENKVIAVTAGYMIIKVLERLPVIIHETLSADQALILLKKQRVDAAVSLCQISKYIAKDISKIETYYELVYPPLNITSGYLIFSRKFFENNSELVHQVWNYFIDLDDKHIYKKYIH